MSVESVDELVSGGPEVLADDMFDSLSSALRDHRDARMTKKELRDSLVRADEAFDRLHAWIREGGPLPGPWRKHYVPVCGDKD